MKYTTKYILHKVVKHDVGEKTHHSGVAVEYITDLNASLKCNRFSKYKNCNFML